MDREFDDLASSVKVILPALHIKTAAHRVEYKKESPPVFTPSLPASVPKWPWCMTSSSHIGQLQLPCGEFLASWCFITTWLCSGFPCQPGGKSCGACLHDDSDTCTLVSIPWPLLMQCLGLPLLTLICVIWTMLLCGYVLHFELGMGSKMSKVPALVTSKYMKR